MFEEQDYTKLTDQLIKTPLSDILTQWSAIREKDKPTALRNCYEVRSFLKRSVYGLARELVKDENKLTPISAYMLMSAIVGSQTKQEFLQKKRQYRLKNEIKSDIKLADYKNQATNTQGVLEKLYCCFTYDQAYNYVQLGKILKDVKIADARIVADLELAHSNISRLLSWFRLAILTKMTIYNENYENPLEVEGGIALPDQKTVLEVVNTTVDVLESTQIFPGVVYKILRQSQDLSGFFIIIDAILMNLKHPAKGDTLKIRRRLAKLFILRDFLDDTAEWVIIHKLS